MKKYIPLAVFLVTAVLGVAMAGFAYVASERANRLKFEGLAEDALGRIEARLQLHHSLVGATLAFFEARGGGVDIAAFRSFIAGLDTETVYDGIQGIGFARLIRAGEEEVARTELYENYAVATEIWPATNQEWRTPIVMLEPLDRRNTAALGYDMYADEARRQAITRALENGVRQASGAIELVQEIDGRKQPGFLVYAPFVKPGRAVGEGGLKPDDVAGFVFAPFRAGDLFDVALSRPPVLPVNVEAYDAEPSGSKLLYRSPAPAGSAFSDRYLVERKVSFAGRLWDLRFRPTETFDPSFSTLISVLLGVISLLLAAALALSARYQARTVEAVNLLHETAERNLTEKDMMLQEMKHRIKNSIARVLAIARQTARGAETVEDFTESFVSRLQAMATSQDMQARSGWRRADLKELLGAELRQVYGEDFDTDRLDGPPVELNESATQALGLTFHELATNALKYGSAGAEGADIDIAWRVDAGDGARRLEIDWRESGGADVAAPETTGFGTRLIEANVVHELRGEISRDFAPDGLKIRIRVPLD